MSEKYNEAFEVSLVVHCMLTLHVTFYKTTSGGHVFKAILP